MSWIPLNSEEQLQEISTATGVHVLFKHSTRCSISSMALNRMNRAEFGDNATYYLLDLIQYRNISNAIAQKFGVEHESPQVIILNNGEVIYTASHGSISPSEIESIIQTQK